MLNNVQDENRKLRCQLKDSTIKLGDAQARLIKFEEELEDVKGKLATKGRDNESDRVLIKDLVFENENKRKYIVSLEDEIRDLKKAKSKLYAENFLIRKLGKQISDDSDNLLEIITKLKNEKDTADKKIVLLESENSKIMSDKKKEFEDIGLKSEDVQEVNESLNISFHMEADNNEEENVGLVNGQNVDENVGRHIVNNDVLIEDVAKVQSLIYEDEDPDHVLDEDTNRVKVKDAVTASDMDENENVG